MLPAHPSAPRPSPLLRGRSSLAVSTVAALSVACLEPDASPNTDGSEASHHRADGTAAQHDSASADTGALGAVAPVVPWLDSLSARLERSARAFHPREGTWQAHAPGFQATLDDSGAHFTRSTSTGAGSLHISLDGWGREGAVESVSIPSATAGVCTPAVGADGDCIRRVERMHPGLDEWWVALDSGVEFGFDLFERPAGDAPLIIALHVDGAQLDTDGATAWLTDDTGGAWTLSGTLAWDADGEPLATLVEIDADDRLVLVVDDHGARWPITVDPVISTAAVVLSDGSTADGHGYDLDGAGDVNGDGFDDVIVGAPFGSNAVYIYFGSATGLASSPDQTIATPLAGTADDDWGKAVAGAGDVNNDGFDDVIVGASKWNSDEGRAVVLLGSATGVASTGTELAGGGTGELGASVSTAGDVNDDGFDDVIVGEPENGAGVVYVYHGSATGIDATIQTTITAGTSARNLGNAVSTAGDVNDDGFDDVIIGDDGASGFAGQMHVHHGSPTGVSATAARTITGGFSFSRVGTDVDAAGDINNDGIDDVVVGAMGNSTVLPFFSIYHGSSTGISGSASTTVTGTAGTSFARTVAGLGDVNADGYDDILVGAPATGTSFQGEASLFLGGRSGVQSTAESRVIGTTTGQNMGAAVGGAGDVNGDGYNDLLVATGFGFYRVHVFHGAPTDQDGDGVLSDVDCDDTNPSAFPGATEVPGDGVDSDCDGTEICYADADADGFTDGTVSSTDTDCSDPGEATGASSPSDCDDSDPAIFPAATELVGDGVDSDCNGTEICYADTDTDGFTSGVTTSADIDCTGTGEATSPSADVDCDDFEATTYPGAPEGTGDEVDSDCDGTEVCYADADTDGFTNGTVASADTDCGDAGEATTASAELDCDDAEPTTYPGAPETTGDQIDSDCDGTEVCFADADEDGFTSGTVTSADADCTDSGERTAASTTADCDDTDAAVNPAATERTGDELDSDCDGTEICYADTDQDGFTSGTVTSPDIDCSAAGEATAATADVDCDDTDATIFPGGTELPGDAVDSDCDGTEVCYADADGDGFTLGTVDSPDVDCSGTGEAGSASTQLDCDDTDASVNPTAIEVAGNGMDDDCDGTAACWADADNDGYIDGATTTLSFDADCTDPGEAADGAPTGECDDTDPTVHPGATEGVGDGIDSNCDGAETCFADADGDGFASSASISIASVDADCTDFGEADAGAPQTDCDDADATVRPGATELCDGLDNDCDGVIDPDTAVDTLTFYADADADGFGDATTTVAACTVPSGHVDDATDCDDAAATVYPGADELCDGLDNDCDGVLDPDSAVDAPTWYADGDGDGYGSPASSTTSCEAPPGHVDDASDCDDDNRLVRPGADEWPNDGVDQDCDGEDTVKDGHLQGGCSTTATAPSRGLGLLVGLVGLLGWRRRDG